MIRQEWRGVRANIVRLILPTAVAVVGRLPFAVVQRLGAAIGALGWLLTRRDRGRALEHLAIAFPERSPAERKALGRACYRHLGITMTESLYMMRGDCETLSRHVDVEGWENIEAMRAAGRTVP